MSKSHEKIDPESISTALTGQLFDAPLVNMNYHSKHFVGITSTQGEFLYLPNESITFTLGNYQFSEIEATSHLSIVDLFPRHEASNSVVNLNRLLQSIGEVTPSNKMILPDLAAFDLAALDFSKSINLFAKDALVLKLLSKHGNQLNPLQLVPAGIKLDQFATITNDNDIPVSDFAKTPMPKTALQVTSL